MKIAIFSCSERRVFIILSIEAKATVIESLDQSTSSISADYTCNYGYNGTGRTFLADGGSPAWSPDGSKIAFVSDRDGNSEIYVMNADGTNQTNISNNPAMADYGPVWPP